MSVPQARVAPAPDGRFLPVDHLRAFITLLVVAHHAVLAYHQYSPPVPASLAAAPMLWRAFPVVDAAKWPGIEILVIFNDSFFMMLMFLLGGLFVSRSLAVRGAWGYVRERALRLGVPFLVSAAVLAPLAYYASYLQSGGTPGLAAYWQTWPSLGVWPAGPAWFLWVLLAISLIVASAHALAPSLYSASTSALGNLAQRPTRFALVFIALAVLIYFPTTLLVDGMTWNELGPFTVQTARVGLYVLYFVIGVALGAQDVAATWARDGAFGRRWAVWHAIAPIVFFVFLGVLIALFIQLGKGVIPKGLAMATSVLFAVTGAVTSLMAIATAARFGHRGGPISRSLHRNAYGIYLVHYVFVAWLQYALLPVGLPGWVKAIGVFVGAVALSWGTTALLRRIPAVARVI